VSLPRRRIPLRDNEDLCGEGSAASPSVPVAGSAIGTMDTRRNTTGFADELASGIQGYVGDLEAPSSGRCLFDSWEVAADELADNHPKWYHKSYNY
jgi:hypothetical protein